MLDASQPEEVLLDENKEAEEHEFYMVRHCTSASQGLLGSCHLLCCGWRCAVAACG